MQQILNKFVVGYRLPSISSMSWNITNIKSHVGRHLVINITVGYKLEEAAGPELPFLELVLKIQLACSIRIVILVFLLSFVGLGRNFIWWFSVFPVSYCIVLFTIILIPFLIFHPDCIIFEINVFYIFILSNHFNFTCKFLSKTLQLLKFSQP